MADFSQFENFALNSVTLDLVRDSSGNILGVYGDERIRQECEQAIRPQKGTVPLDLTAGIDWLGYLRGDIDDAALRADIGEQLLGVSGVARISDIIMERTELPEGADRLSVTFTVFSATGTPIGGEVSIP